MTQRIGNLSVLVLFCLLVWGSLADHLRVEKTGTSRTVFGRKLRGGKEELVEIECPTDDVCTVPKRISLLNPQTMKAVRSVKVEKIEDSALASSVEASGGELPLLERPTFKVTFKKKIVGLRILSESAVLLFRQQLES